MGNYSAYINVKNLTKLNNRMLDAIDNPEKELDLTFINNKSCLSVVSYKFYQDCIKNIKSKLKELKGSKYYEVFAEAVDSFVNKAYLGEEVSGNFYLLSAIGEAASRMSMLCYRGDEIGYEKPDDILKRSIDEIKESKEAGKELSIIEPIYKEIMESINDNLKDIKPENLPVDLKYYYDIIDKELKDFKVD